MVNFKPHNEPLTPGFLLQLICLWSAFVLTLVCVGNAMVMESALPRSLTVFEGSLSTLAEWINKTGQTTVIRGLVAHSLGFPAVDLPVRQRGFRGEQEKLTHVCSVSQRGQNAVFLALVDEDSGDATIWRTTVQGILVSAASFSDGEVQPIAIAAAESPFVTEKDYILKQMRIGNFGPEPAPVPRSFASPHPLDVSRPTIPEAWKDTALPSEFVLFLIHPWLLPLTVLVIAVSLFRGGRSL